MLNRTFRALVGALALCTVVPVVAVAQSPVTDETNNLTATIPAGWEALEGNERAVFNFKETNGFAQVEIIATPMLTPEASTTFFDTFHTTLTEAEFVQTGSQDATYGAFSGRETVYQFAHTNTTLKVVVFQFVNENTAWLVIGYMQETSFDQQLPVFQSVAQSLTFGG